jgi:hypothetical protein
VRFADEDVWLTRENLEGKRQVQREIEHYNLDMIIAIGYRVQSPIAVRFRRWATQRLHEYIQKGFTMDDERLKQGVFRQNLSPLSEDNFSSILNKYTLRSWLA